MNNSNIQEAFIVYHKGVAVQLQWTTLPPLARSPAMKLCTLDQEYLLLLTADNCMYKGRLNLKQNILYLELERNDVLDVDFCKGSQQLFLVTTMGVVLLQQVTTVSGYRTNAWQQLTFDPLELSEHGVRIQSVSCTEKGIVFVTESNELYVMGSCGNVFNSEIQPKHFRIFEKNSKILDVAAGDEFFIILLQRNYFIDEQSLRIQNSIAQKIDGNLLNVTKSSLNDISHDADKRTELNSNSSLRSYSSKSSHSHCEPTFEMRQQDLIKKGYSLVNTQVHTFGASNNGLLGTGDHIKRSSINLLQKLDSIGVCNITAGKEHSVVSTLDGRVYHWGLNSENQLSPRSDIEDLSSPKELNFDAINLSKEESNIIETCCGDYQTIILNANADAIEKDNKILPLTAKDLLTLQLGSNSCKKPIHLLLSSGSLTLRNLRAFQRDYFTWYHELQIQMRILLKYRYTVNIVQMFQKKTTASAIRLMQAVCSCYKKILYILAAFLQSLKNFYIGDLSNPLELIFINFYRECIKVFEDYVKAHCDTFSIDGYNEVYRIINHLTDVPLLPKEGDSMELSRVFEQPFKIYPILLEFLEQLVKKQDDFKEHLNAWQEFARETRIALELAESTRDFWRSNERNTKVQHFRRKSRRVILTSITVPLKLGNNGMSMSSTTFILFSDCLCQMGSQVYTYPLTTLWVKIESDTGLMIITPERKFTLIARSHFDKMLWFDQLQSSIMSALGQAGAKQSTVRTTAYVFSKKHAKYPSVHAYGRWRNGEMHGNCYLEYSDGRCYFGEMKHGEIEGQGKMVIPQVGLYEGYFKAGKFHGFGVYELKDNEIYEGNFRDGLFHGHGFLRSNSYTFVGEYQANAKCGYGILDDMMSGHKYMGMFADNKRIGAGTCITMNGDYFEGIFANDELSGTGLAVFENDYYYEGELTMNGPSGKGSYYMPSGCLSDRDSGVGFYDDIQNQQLIGNVLTGQLGGTWNDVRIISGKVSLNRQFPKYPKSIGEFSVDNNRKWRSLFENFEEQIFSSTSKTKNSYDQDTTNHPNKLLWSRIAIFMTTERERERKCEQQDVAIQSTHNYFAKNISLNYTGGLDKLSIKSSNSLLSATKASLVDLSSSLSGRKTQSQETLNIAELSDFELNDSTDAFNLYQNQSSDNSFSSMFNSQLDGWLNDSRSSTRSSLDSIGNFNNNSYSSVGELQFIPHFGINSLTEQDVASIKEYLAQAFRDRHHPLFLLNKRIANCFYTAYGCWKVKPSPLLAKQALLEWESISKRIYKFIRKLFPALPEEYCVMESSKEVISHITLLYPIVLSEGIYSTLFLLYANKYSRKDEMYRQNVNFAEKLPDEELANCLSLESAFLPVIQNSSFLDAIKTLKQLQEKYSPKDMLTVIEKCMHQITDAYKVVGSENCSALAADSMMPLTLFLTLRAAVPHLGAELALLDDLTGGANYQFEMNGLAGYCFTTLKAAYEHITSKSLKKY